MQRREQQKRAQGQGYSSMGGSMAGGYTPTPRYEAPAVSEYRAPSPAVAPVSKPAFKGAGMKLGKKGKQSELMSALGGEAEVEPEPEPQAAPETKVEAVEVSADVLAKVEQER